MARNTTSLLALLLISASQAIAQPTAPDNPEPGLSGAPIAVTAANRPVNGVFPKPYSRGVRIVGHSARGGMQMAWIDQCAYLAGSAGPGGRGIAVVDVSNPAAPRDVRVLTDPGASAATENFDARVGPKGRKVLVGGVRAVGGTTNNDPSRLSIYDATDCENPKHMAEYVWPKGTHTVHISPDTMLVYGMRLDAMSGAGGINVLDISDLAHPRYVGEFGVTGPDGRSWEFGPHNIVVSEDGRRIYAATANSGGGDLNRTLKLVDNQDHPDRFQPTTGGVYILDSSDFALKRPNPKFRLIATVEHAGWHDITLASFNGVPHLVGTGEGIVPCPGAFPMITNIADLKRPRPVGAFRTDMNRPENCPPLPPPPPPAARNPDGTIQYPTGAARAAATAGFSKESSHYSSVDSSTNTRIGMFSMNNAGFRIADLRNPANPVEIAYFRPGPGCSGFSRYVEKTGHIWMSCGAAGFYVLELTPEVQSALKRR